MARFHLASGSSITYLLDGIAGKKNKKKTRGGKVPPPPQSSAFFFSVYRYPFRSPSDCAPSRVIGRGRAFHLYGPVCTHVQASIVVHRSRVSKRDAFFVFLASPNLPLHTRSRVFPFLLPQPILLHRPSITLNHSTCPFRIETRDALSALNVDARLIAASDSLVETPVERDGCRGGGGKGLTLWRKRKLTDMVEFEEVEDRCFDRVVCFIGKLI